MTLADPVTAAAAAAIGAHRYAEAEPAVSSLVELLHRAPVYVCTCGRWSAPDGVRGAGAERAFEQHRASAVASAVLAASSPVAVEYVPGDPGCAHADWVTAECEGWEDPSEPLSIRVTCGRCSRHIDAVVADPSMLEWEL